MNGIDRASFRIPCPARSVSINHDAETAYFEVPRGASHGIRLICRHPDCAKKQSKRPRFRYCAICHTAVSYKNFHLRHSHLGEQNSSKKGVDPSKGSSTKAPPALLTKTPTQKLSQQEREWLDLFREHPAHLGYSADDTKQWMDAVRAVTPAAFHSWMTNVLMLPINIEPGATETIPIRSAWGVPSQVGVKDASDLLDESVTSSTASGYFSEV